MGKIGRKCGDFFADFIRDFEFQMELIWAKESKLVYVGLIHLFQELLSS